MQGEREQRKFRCPPNDHHEKSQRLFCEWFFHLKVNENFLLFAVSLTCHVTTEKRYSIHLSCSFCIRCHCSHCCYCSFISNRYIVCRQASKRLFISLSPRKAFERNESWSEFLFWGIFNRQHFVNRVDKVTNCQ